VWGGNNVLIDKGRARGFKTTIYIVNKDWAILNTAIPLIGIIITRAL
jgi:hypothetical protein